MTKSWIDEKMEEAEKARESDRLAQAATRRRWPAAFRAIKFLAAVLAMAGAALVLNGVAHLAMGGLSSPWVGAFRIACGGICILAAFWEFAGAGR